MAQRRPWMRLAAGVGVLMLAGGVPGCASDSSGHPRPLSESRRAELKARIDAVVSQYVSSPNNPGLVVGVVEDGRRGVFAYGTISLTSHEEPGGATLFEIGSITKVFTTALLAEMADANLAALDDPVRRLLPESVRVPASGDREITLLHLASHTSGLPRLPDNLLISVLRNPANPYAKYTVADLYEFLSEHELSRPPGQKFEYSNVGMGLLGRALALKCGTTYEKALVERICDRLGLSDTRITLSPEQQKRLLAGHSPWGHVVPHWDIPALPGAGALRSTPDDMLTFLSANLGSAGGRSGAILARTHPIRAQTDLEGMEVALGWLVGSLPGGGRKVFWHNSGTGGFRGWSGFVKETQTGVIVLSNSSNDVDPVGWEIIGLLNETDSRERP